MHCQKCDEKDKRIRELEQLLRNMSASADEVFARIREAAKPETNIVRLADRRAAQAGRN